MLDRSHPLRRKWLAFYALEGLVRRVHNPEPPRPLAHFAMGLSACALVGLCGLNDAIFVGLPQFQAIAQSLFCLYVGGLYAVYMLTSILAHLVFMCTDAHEEDYEEGEAMIDDDEEKELDALSRQRDTLPRETVVSSMYFGGVGAFLAIAPLCMWNCAVTLAFLGSLFVVAIAIEQNTRTPVAVMLTGVTALTLACSAWVEASSAPPHRIPNGSHAQIAVFLDQSPHWPAWPFMLLATTSPLFLFVGNGAGLQAFHSMPPSRTLETGLPVCMLLACIVLGWFNPLEALVLAEPLSNLREQILMLLLAPLLLSATLAFLLHALRSHSVLPATAILTSIMTLRQQTFRHGGASPRAIDAATLTFAVLGLVLATTRLGAGKRSPQP